MRPKRVARGRRKRRSPSATLSSEPGSGEHREQLDAALAGPHGAKLAALLGFLESLTLAVVPRTLERVRADNWAAADADTRFLVLRLINAAIVRLREQADLEPFDDPMFDRPPDPFLVLRGVLR